MAWTRGQHDGSTGSCRGGEPDQVKAGVRMGVVSKKHGVGWTPRRPEKHGPPGIVHRWLALVSWTTFSFCRRGGVCPCQHTGGWHYVKVVARANQ
jgi:hypothetical protein